MGPSTARYAPRAGPARSAQPGVALLLAAALLAAGCSTSPPAAPRAASRRTAVPGPAAPSGSWPYPNGDLANTRDAAGSTISSANVSRLRLAWTFKLTGPATAGVSGVGSLAAGPVVAGGVVYLQDLNANVYALNLATGKLRWEYRVNKPEQSGPGPDGVAVADGMVYGDTSTSAFALSARTGRTVWVDRSLLRPGQGAFEIQPQVSGGRVYLASAYGGGPGGGVLLALNAATGHLLWTFATILGPDHGAQASGVGAGGAWETPLVSPDGSVTYGIGNPYQSAATAIAHPARLLYTDSDVNLDAATGKLRWYFQGVPDDFKDYDLQASPIATVINGAPAVIAAGKMGYVYAISGGTGRLIWKTPVGVHNGHDNDSLGALEHRSTVKAPYTIFPGSLGGVLTNLALAGHSLYVATIDLPFTITKLTQVLGAPSGAATGEVEALNLATGRVEWDTKVPQMPLGAATVANDLVFTTLYSGVLVAIDRDTGAIVYQRQLPTTANSPIAVAGNALLVPAGGPKTVTGGGDPQLVAYTVP